MLVQGKDGKQKPHMVVLGEQDPETGLAPMYIQATRGGTIDRYKGENIRALMQRFDISTQDVQDYHGGKYEKARDGVYAAFLGLGGELTVDEQGEVDYDKSDAQKYNVQEKLQEQRINQLPTLNSSINTLIADGVNEENIDLLSQPATSGGLVGHTIPLNGNESMKITNVERVPGRFIGYMTDEVFVYAEDGTKERMKLDALRGFVGRLEPTRENSTNPAE